MLIKLRESVTLKSQKVNILASAVIAAGLSFAAIPAHAASDIVSVKIDKSELTTEAGLKRTYYKLRQVADNACQADSRVSLPQQVAIDNCVDSVMRNFISQVDSQQLLAFHEDVFVKAG